MVRQPFTFWFLAVIVAFTDGLSWTGLGRYSEGLYSAMYLLLAFIWQGELRESPLSEQ